MLLYLSVIKVVWQEKILIQRMFYYMTHAKLVALPFLGQNIFFLILVWLQKMFICISLMVKITMFLMLNGHTDIYLATFTAVTNPCSSSISLPILQ